MASTNTSARERRTTTAASEVLMTPTRRVLAVLSAVCLAGTSCMAWSQQKVPFSFGVPVAPTGLADQPLAEGPFLYHTAEQQDIRVTVFTRGLEYPYSLAFLPN